MGCHLHSAAARVESLCVFRFPPGGNPSHKSEAQANARPAEVRAERRRVLVSARKWFRLRSLWVAVAVVVVAGVGALLMHARGGPEPQPIAFSDLLKDLDRGQLAEVVVNGDTLDVTHTDGRVTRTTTPANYVTANPSFVP